MTELVVTEDDPDIMTVQRSEGSAPSPEVLIPVSAINRHAGLKAWRPLNDVLAVRPASVNAVHSNHRQISRDLER